MFERSFSDIPPRMLVGETLYSWVSRGVNQRYFRAPQRFLKVIERDFPKWPSREIGASDLWGGGQYVDFEFDMSSSLFSLVRETVNLNDGVLRQFYGARGQWLTHLCYRRLCCSSCFRESMLRHNQPVWKKLWCYATTAVCPEHGDFLIRSRDNRSPHCRIWDEYINSIEWRDSKRTIPLRRFAMLALKVQKTIQGNQIKRGGVLRSVHTLYGLLLSKRTPFSPEGLAAAGFGRRPSTICHSNLTIVDRISYGASDSDAYQRGGALIMLGWVVGLISDSEIVYLTQNDHFARRTFPRSLSLELFGRMVMRVNDSEEAQYVVEQLSGLIQFNNSSVNAFLRGIHNGLQGFTRRTRPSLVHRPCI